MLLSHQAKISTQLTDSRAVFLNLTHGRQRLSIQLAASSRWPGPQQGCFQEILGQCTQLLDKAKPRCCWARSGARKQGHCHLHILEGVGGPGRETGVRTHSDRGGNTQRGVGSALSPAAEGTVGLRAPSGDVTSPLWSSLCSPGCWALQAGSRGADGHGRSPQKGVGPRCLPAP